MDFHSSRCLAICIISGAVFLPPVTLFNNMKQQKRQQHLENIRNRVQYHRNAGNIEHQIYYIGALDVRCQFCGALRFQRELLNCCHNGKFSLTPLQENPQNLRLLFDADNAESSNFRQNIRKYNSAFAFASFGANIMHPPRRGPYCSVYKVKLTTMRTTSIQMILTLKRGDTASSTS